jgi:biotin carboxyl carrier protein
MSTYVVTMEGREFEVDIAPDGTIMLKGCTERIHIQPVHGDVYSVFIGNRSTQIVAKRNGGEYQALLSNDQVDICVETGRERLLKKYETSIGATHRKLEIRAPMPALVGRVEVAVGDLVQPGQGLLILEAMKMENEIKSHQAGTIKEIFVVKGKPVEKGELLMLLE